MSAPFMPDLNPFASPFAALSDLEDNPADPLALSMDALNALIGLHDALITAHADNPSRVSAAIKAVLVPLLEAQMDRLAVSLGD